MSDTTLRETSDLSLSEPHVEAGTPRRVPTLYLLLALIAALLLLRPYIVRLLDGPLVQTWGTLFVSITLQALPFLVLGVLVSGSIAAFVPASLFPRMLPKRPLFAVPMASAAGGLLPGCECGSVPISARLIRRGAPPAAALAFMLSAPAINPIVVISTIVAFPGRPEVAVARFVASLVTAIVVGLIWSRRRARQEEGDVRAHGHEGATRWATLRETVVHDMLHAGGYLVLGAAVAATLQVAVPRSVLDAVGGTPVLAVAALAILAVILSICSEADAFVAASLTPFPLSARLAFLVVGPAVDVKLIALQIGTFGRSFAARFAPLTFGVALVVSAIVGELLL